MPPIDRRDFFKGSAAVMAGLALAAERNASSRRADHHPAEHDAARPAGANDVIRVACVGFHGRGQAHIAHFSRRKDTAVVALCDVDGNVLGQTAEKLEKRTGKPVRKVIDLRHLLDDKNIDVISIATPNHWHALAGIWAMEAGKDVYVEKPVSHTVSEGRRLVEAARKYHRVCQTGTQSRSAPGVRAGIEFLRSGGLGQIYMARGLCFKPRGSIGHKPDGPVPRGVDYNLWLGPAPERPFNPNRFHYNWHWNWDYGNGDIGNQGIHQMDIARWGLGKGLAETIESCGGRYGYHDDGQTPNTQVATFRYPDCQLVFEVRGLNTNDEHGVRIGNLFYGTRGWAVISGDRFASFFGPKNEPGFTSHGGGEHLHFDNFVAAVKARKPELLHAEILEGHLSSALCHLANISYLLGRSVVLDSKTETFGSDAQANALLTREYRSPFIVPETV